MKTFPKRFSVHCGSFPVLLLVTTWAVSACSGTSDSVSTDNQPASVNSASSMNSASNVSNETFDVPGAEMVIEENTGDPASNDTQTSPDVAAPNSSGDSSNPVVVDPLIQNRILVSFDISVPAYQSNELRLELVWGDLNFTAGWVGDELWTVSGEFPTETEELLTVTFFDNNGAIELASYSQQLRTGSNATETFQISADQFDHDQFDADGDGISNLDELIAGNNPTIDEDSLLDIRDSFGVASGGTSVAANLESLLSEERPISTNTREQVTSSVTIDTDIQIDLDGNGTLNWEFNFDCEFDIRSAIRTNTGNSISWEADRTQNDCDFTLRGNLANTVTIVDESTRTYVETGFLTRTGSFTTTSDVETNLVGQLVEGTSLCEPVSGTFSETFRTNNNGNRIIVTLVSKEINDPYWRVRIETSEAIFAANGANILGFELAATSEYFVRELSFGWTPLYQTSNLFICDFVDI